MGIHSTTKSMADLMKLLVNDTELKEAMNIPASEHNDATILTNKYFLQTYLSDTTINEPISVLLIRTAPQIETNNDYVRWDSIIIEIYVHKDIESKGLGFKRRSHMIVDRLVKLLHNKYVNSDLYRLADKNELQSGTPGYRRSYVRFMYKSIYV